MAHPPRVWLQSSTATIYAHRFDAPNDDDTGIIGGTASDRRQYITWIHGSDFIRAVLWCIDHDISGPLIVAAPEPLPNAQFMRVLREAWGTRVGLPASRWMLDVGAVLMQTETELILKSRRVVPSRLLADGFVFQYPHWRGAAEELCARWRGAGG